MPPNAKRRKSQKMSHKLTQKNAQKATQTYATITDLPNELLSIILEQVDNSDLRNLARLCKRLHVNALSLFFSRNHIHVHDGSIGYLSSNTYHCYSAIREALFIQRVGWLNASVYPHKWAYIHSLELLILRMSTVRNVSFSIDSDWKSATPLALVFKALQNKSCEGLSITDCSRGLNLTCRPTRVALQPIRTLQRVNIAADHLLLPPWADWMTRSINLSPVTHLTLQCHKETLTAALPLLTLPHLTSFKLVCTQLELTILTPFLTRHPNIFTLELDPTLLLDCSIANGLLPQLGSIRCGTSTICHLLREPTALPRLQSVDLNYSMCQPAEHIVKFLQSLASTKASCLRMPMIPDHVASKCKRLVKPSRRRPRSGRTGSRIPPNLITSLILSFVSPPVNSIANLLQWLSFFPALTTLSIQSTWLAVPKREAVAVVERLEVACPHIKQVYFDNVGGTLEHWHSVKNSLEQPSESQSR